MKKELQIGIVLLIVGILIGTAVGWVAKPAPEGAKIEEPKGAREEPKYEFYYVSHGGPANPWWGTVRKGIDDASALLNVKTNYMGPEKFSLEALTNLMESAIVAKPDGIILTITSVEALDPLVRDATNKGIPVIAVNINDNRPKSERMPYIGYVGQDEYDAGTALAERALEEFTPTRVVIGMHEPGHVGHERRAKGIMDVMNKKGIPAEKLDIGLDPVMEVETFRSYLMGHPDTDLILTLGPEQAYAAVKAVEEMGKIGKIKTATIDVNDDVMKGILDGSIICGVSQQPYMQGFIPVVWMYLHKECGFIPPEKLPTGPAIIDRSTLDLIQHQLEVTGGA